MNVKIDYKFVLLSDVRLFDGCEAWSNRKVTDFLQFWSVQIETEKKKRVV